MIDPIPTTIATTSNNNHANNNATSATNTTAIAASPLFRDMSTECGICLNPLHDNDNDDNDPSSASSTNICLDSCGHSWHLDCLRQQISIGHVVGTRRLVFGTDTACDKCGVPCRHETLVHDRKRTANAQLRNKVGHRIILAPLLSTKDDNKSFSAAALALCTITNRVRGKDAFYLCDSKCREPFTTGKVSKQTQEQQADDSCITARYCPNCSRRTPTTQSQSNISDNLLVNPHGQEGFQGWRRLTINDSWQVETSTTPYNEHITTNFVSTHFWCEMEQTVNLTKSENSSPSTSSSVQVAASFMGHAECPSVFRLSAEFLDAQGTVLHKQSTRILSTANKAWQRTALLLPPTLGAASVKMILHGKDGQLRPGHYGSKVTNCSVRIIPTKPASSFSSLLPMQQ